ncbi:MAG: Gfo/Idh/MocA family oxidoreductase [Opitutaceae bacterium]|nr:Gfo/Idh/MocA family oxidoreductase [Opitutaceae bacterium]
MNNAPARIAAVIGCGKFVEGKEGWAIGHAHADAYRQADPALRLVGVDINPDNLRAFGERFGVAPADLFTSTDAMYAALTPHYVSVCTWPKLHAPQVIEAAARGVRGIVCEKPMALDGAEIDAMLAACERAGTRLAIAHQRCYNAPYVLAKRLLDQGAIGEHPVLEARVGDGWDILSWSVHWFDLTHWLFDAAPLSVLAGVDHTGARRYQHAVENASVIFAEYPGDRQAIFITGPHNHHGEVGDLFIRGTRGFMRIRGDVEVWNEAGYTRQAARAEGPTDFHALVLDLFNAVETGAPMRCDASRTANSTRTAYAAHESARLRRVIHAPFQTGFAPLEVLQHPPRPALPAGRVVLFADEHFGSGGREGIAEAITELTGTAPLVIDATKGLTAADLADAGALLLYHTQSEPSDSTRAALTTWVESGKPTVFVHCACGGYPNWDAYKQWAGRVWVWGPGGSEHPYEPCTLTPLGAGVGDLASAWLPLDEVFIKLASTSETEDLAEVQISSGRYPAAWRSKRWPNITAWIPGHRREMWTLPALREGLLAQIRLAAS